ncbi:MAG TPA: carboxylating nicotinate-nucleotide diphosphorylase [Bacteroidota bacterium]|nr:carboxylating nicotinate-nucleotide diphosphorylase [Bacteroidota bacterium]
MGNNVDSKIVRLVEQALFEDVGFGDVTSESTIPDSQQSRATFLCKETGVLSGIEIAQLVFRLVDERITMKPLLADTSLIRTGVTIAEIEGPTRGILLGERVALNFLQRMSGIASLTHMFVHAVAGTGAKITDTRKTVPGLRVLEKKAVRDGGGVNHRFGLDQMVLIKDNHVAAAGGITPAIEQCKRYLSAHSIAVPIEVETDSIDQVREALACGGIDRIMLDNYPLDVMREAVALIDHRVEVEASGGITMQTVRGVAETGVDFISVGALTHSPKALDISLDTK